MPDQLPDRGPSSENLHQAITQGLQHALTDFGVDLLGCGAETLSGHVIQELKRIPGWRPPARKIESVEDLEALPDRTVILTRYGTAAQRSGDVWEFPDEIGQYLGDAIDLPATVLWSPNDTTERPTE